MNPAMRAAFLVSFIWCFSLSDWRSWEKSQRPAITAQPDCRRDECRGEYQAKPKTWRAQVRARGQSRAVDGADVKSERRRRESHQTVFQHRGEMRSAECDSLEKCDRQKRKARQKKFCPPRPA